MKPDVTLARIREARHSASDKCGRDPKRLIEYYMELQRQYHERLVRFSDSPPPKEAI